MFIVVNFSAPCIIGLPFIEQFKLLKRIGSVEQEDDSLINSLIKKYDSIFQGIGELTKSYKIQLKKNIEPVVEPPRKIAISIQQSVKHELDKMEKMGIVRKVREPSEWCSSMVTVKKPDNSLRICLDPQNLNKAIIREWYQLPTFEEIASKMEGANIFSILDGNKGFYQIKLDEESEILTTFNAGCFGRYCYKRMPYGLCSAPEVFHRTFKDIFDGLPGVEIYIDDVIVWATNKEEHNQRLEAVLERAKCANVRCANLEL